MNFSFKGLTYGNHLSIMMFNILVFYGHQLLTRLSHVHAGQCES